MPNSYALVTLLTLLVIVDFDDVSIQKYGQIFGDASRQTSALILTVCHKWMKWMGWSELDKQIDQNPNNVSQNMLLCLLIFDNISSAEQNRHVFKFHCFPLFTEGGERQHLEFILS